MLAELNFLGFSLTMITIFFGTVIVCMFIVLFVSKKRTDIERKRKTNSFKNAFDTTPHSALSDRTPGEQSIVDRKLKTLAMNFDRVASKKNEVFNLIRMYREGGNNDTAVLNELFLRGLISNEQTIDDVVKNLEYATNLEKVAFWYAHDLAKFFGYNVKEKYSDYVNYLEM